MCLRGDEEEGKALPIGPLVHLFIAVTQRALQGLELSTLPLSAVPPMPGAAMLKGDARAEDRLKDSSWSSGPSI